jgi:hypothetical protein
MPKVWRVYPMNTYYRYTYNKYAYNEYTDFEPCENGYTQNISTHGEDT